jgi:serine 3-dehydrogenase
MKLVLAARRVARLEALARELAGEGVEVEAFSLDVRDRAAVDAFASKLAARGIVPDVLVNNAGLSRGLEPLQRGSVDDWEEMIDANVKGLLYVSRALLPRMIEAGRGHVVNIGSVAGREAYPGGNVYCATKAAVAMLGRAINADLLGTPIRLCTIEPGMVLTEFSEVRFHGDKERAAKVYEGVEHLVADDIAEAVAWVVTRPPHVNVQDMLIMPTMQRNPYLIERRN